MNVNSRLPQRDSQTSNNDIQHPNPLQVENVLHVNGDVHAVGTVHYLDGDEYDS